MEKFKSPGHLLTDGRTNERGSTVCRSSKHGAARYEFDCRHCAAGAGWIQYDTEQDAWFFGIWVRRSTREVVSYIEGDIIHITAPSDEAFAAELAALAKFYGDAPPVATVLTKDGDYLEVFSARPE